MKAYQVFSGEQNKHGNQIYDLVATYLDKDRAIEHARQIAQDTPLYGDILEEGEFFGDGKFKEWDAIGWERVCVSRFQEIEITE
jgi:hypothetical protein